MAVVLGVGREVCLFQETEAVHRVGSVPRPFPEGPPAPVVDRLDGGQRDDVLDPLQCPHDRTSVRPGTRPGDVEVIAPDLGRVTARAVSRDAVLKAVLRPLEGGRVALRGRPRRGGRRLRGGRRVVAIGLEVDRAGQSRRRHRGCLLCDALWVQDASIGGTPWHLAPLTVGP